MEPGDVVLPRSSWAWKDEDDFAEVRARGVFDETEAAEIRAEGERVIAARPFPSGCEDGRSGPARPVPGLPAGWDVA